LFCSFWAATGFGIVAVFLCIQGSTDSKAKASGKHGNRRLIDCR